MSTPNNAQKGERPVKVTTSRALIWSMKPGQGAYLVNDRGTDWVGTFACAVRADVLRSMPKIDSDLSAKTFRSIRAKALAETQYPVRACKGEMRGFGVVNGSGRVLSTRGLFVCLNKTVADEWLRHDWHSVTVSIGGPVVIRQLRRGRPIVVAMLMPLHPGGYLTFEQEAA